MAGHANWNDTAEAIRDAARTALPMGPGPLTAGVATAFALDFGLCSG